jgi:hypothetical protein
VKKAVPFEVILVPGGGLTGRGELTEWARRRLDKALEIANGEYIITLSAGTVHKPPVLDKNGYPLFESFVAADYLVKKGMDPEKILREWASYDTIGNAYFTRVIHTDPRKWRRLKVITSEFHMPRTKEIFRWIFSLDAPKPPYQLDFISVTDKGIDPDIILPRVEKEKDSLKKLYELKERISTLKEFHIWLFTYHGAYAVAAEPKRESGNVLDSY